MALAYNYFKRAQALIQMRRLVREFRDLPIHFFCSAHDKEFAHAQRGLIHPRLRESDAKTAAALFAIDDLAAGVVLFALFDLGIGSGQPLV